MAAPMGKALTYSKLSSFHRLCGGIRGVRTLGSKKYIKDRTPAQQYQNDPARIDEKPGPWKGYTDFNAWRKRPKDNKGYDPDAVNKLLAEVNFDTVDDMPVDMHDPFEEKPKRCLLCQHDIGLSYKNPQLLSQFVSSYTGRLYGRHITGLCIHMQRKVAAEIKKARIFGFMPTLHKHPKYMEDPTLFNPFRKKTYPPGQ